MSTMGIKLVIYKAPVEPIRTKVIEVESPALRKILPDGRATECNTNEATCGQFDNESHHVKRRYGGLEESRIGKCKLTSTACLRVANLVARSLERE